MSGEHDRDEGAVAAFVEQTAGMLTGAGFPRMPARVLMALMASEDGGLTAHELRDRLGISAAAVSGAVRYLQTVNIVRRVAQSGTRRERYEMPDDAWYTASVGHDELYEALASLADDGTHAVGAGTPAAARLAEMAAFFRFMNRRLPELLEEWEAQRGESLPAARRAPGRGD